MKKKGVELASKIILTASNKGITLRLSRVFLLMYLCNVYSVLLCGVRMFSNEASTSQVSPVYPSVLMDLGITVDELSQVVAKPFVTDFSMYTVKQEMIIQTVVDLYAGRLFSELKRTVLSERSPNAKLFKKHGAGKKIGIDASLKFYKEFFIQ